MEIASDSKPGNGWLNFAGQVENGMNAQSQMALELKMRSSLMENELNKQQQVEQEKFAREQTVSPQSLGLLQQFAQKYGVNWQAPDSMNQQEYRDNADLLGKLAMMRSMNVATGTQTINDPQTGLPMQTQRINQNNPLGQTIPIGPPTEVPDYKNKVEKYNKIITTVNLAQQAEQQYNNLTLAGPMAGRLGSMIGANAWSTARNDFNTTVGQLAPLTASSLEGVPGGRFSVGLSDKVKGIDANTPASSVKDILNNTLYQQYLQLHRMGGNIPSTLSQRFDSQVGGTDPKTGMPQDGYFFGGKFIPYALHDSIAGSMQAGANPAQQAPKSDPYAGLSVQEKLALIQSRLKNQGNGQ